VLVAVLAVAALAIAWQQWAHDLEAYYWHSQLDSAHDDRVADLLVRVARTGKVGATYLADDLGSSRLAVALEAKRLLVQQCGQATLMAGDAGSNYLLAVSEALAERMNDYEPAAQTVAADLVTRILARPTGSDPTRDARLVAACDRVLRAKAGHPDAGLDEPGRSAHDASIAAKLAQPHLIDPAPAPDGLRRPRLGPIADRVAQQADEEEPAMLAIAKDVRPLKHPTISGRSSVRQTSVDTSSQTPRAERIRTTAEEPDLDPASLRRLPATELFVLLTSNSKWTNAVGGEIARRGFTPREIEVGGHLFSTDTLERLRWIEALPGLSGIDAKNWLLVLSRDSSAEVRLAVVTLMATSSDPQILARVAEMAHSDPDPRVQVQAGRTTESSASASPTDFQ
jgi:hypothetical protein